MKWKTLRNVLRNPTEVWVKWKWKRNPNETVKCKMESKIKMQSAIKQKEENPNKLENVNSMISQEQNNQ